MTIDKSFIGGYWNEKPQNISEAADEIEKFLILLNEVGDIFSKIKLPADKKKHVTNSFFVPNSENIKTQLRKNRKKNEIDSAGHCAIGFLFSAFNEQSGVSLKISCNIGATSKIISNFCYVKLTGRIFSEKENMLIKNLIIQNFSPDKIKVE